MITKKIKLLRLLSIGTPLQNEMSNRSKEFYFFHFYYKKIQLLKRILHKPDFNDV